MGSIIILRSDKFLDSFVEKFNYKNFNFVLISSDIKTKRKYKNVYPLKALIPPSKALSCMMNGNDEHEYKIKYFKHLAKPTVEIYLTTIVKLAVIENTNVVLMCSKHEDEFKYMDLIKDYLESIYKVKVYSYKEFKKNPEKCDSGKKKYDKIEKILSMKIEQAAHCEEPFEIEPSFVLAKLDKMKHKELVKTAKMYGCKVDKDMTNKALIKKIKKKLC